MTTWDLEATRSVVAEQTETETSLRTQATQLQDSLTCAKTDVDGLLAKIGTYPLPSHTSIKYPTTDSTSSDRACLCAGRHCEELQGRVANAGAFHDSCTAGLSSLQQLLSTMHHDTQAAATQVPLHSTHSTQTPTNP